MYYKVAPTMRSVLVHLVDVTVEKVRDTLTEFARKQESNQWLYPPAGDPSLYIRFYCELWEYEPEELVRLERALGRMPAVSVIADVSGHVPGEDEVGAFVEFFLTRFPGVAEDDLAPHCWTLWEIRSGAEIEGRKFFDYQR